MIKPVVAANWKMYKTIEESVSFVEKLKKKPLDWDEVHIILCAPYTSLFEMGNSLRGDSFVSLGAQNLYWEQEGAFTGEISVGMLKACGVEWVIVGHSERRTIFNETNNEVSIKATNSLKNNIHPIICVGETLQQKKNNQTKEILSKQIRESINDDSNNNNTIIAYEPIWAIGSGLTPSFNEIDEIHNFIKNEIRGYENYKILYGGSVKSANSKEILNLDSVDGLLIGRASLNVTEFNKILSF